MNREDTKHAIAVMQAFVDGAEIEFGFGPQALRSPAWDWSSDKNMYRIKPMPRESWVMQYYLHEHVDACDHSGCIKVREVIE